MFDAASLFQVTYGIYILTAKENEKLGGCLVNTVVQLTAEPVRIGVSVSKENETYKLIHNSGAMGITVMDENAATPLLGKFGYRSTRDLDKFEQTRYHLGETGCPLIDEGDLCHLEAKVEQGIDLQTHVFFVGSVVSGAITNKGTPMTYAYYRDVKKGKAGKYAPTYQK